MPALYNNSFNLNYVSYVNNTTPPTLLPYSKTEPIANDPNSLDVDFVFNSTGPIPGFGNYMSSSAMTNRYTGEYFILKAAVYDVNKSTVEPAVIKIFRIDMNPLR
jgi:hypothetical protein